MPLHQHSQATLKTARVWPDTTGRMGKLVMSVGKGGIVQGAACDKRALCLQTRQVQLHSLCWNACAQQGSTKTKWTFPVYNVPCIFTVLVPMCKWTALAIKVLLKFAPFVFVLYIDVWCLVGLKPGAEKPEDCSCLPGSWRPTTDALCEECPIGDYCPLGVRTTCPAHSATPMAGAASVQECICENGFLRLPVVDNNDVCTSCPTGNICDGSSHRRGCNEPLACYVPYYRTQCTATQDYECALCQIPANAVMQADQLFNNACAWQCKAGYYRHNLTDVASGSVLEICKACSVGGCSLGQIRTHCQEGATDDAQCVACPAIPPNTQVISATLSLIHI